jgi:uncharacterized protein (TIGR03086 family)
VEILKQLEGAFDTTGRIVAGVRPDQLSEPTPCKEWDVRAVLAHATTVLVRFRAVALREPLPEPTTEQPEDFVSAYRAAAESALAAWTSPGALEGTCRMPFGAEWPATTAAGVNATDILVHGWDLAKATGQPADLDGRLAAHVLGFAEQALTPQTRAPRIGPALTVAADASVTDRLVAFLGRQP